MFEKFCDVFGLWSYVGEGGPDCFSLLLVVSPLCCVCEGVWVICCVCNLVIVFMDVSRVWGSYSLLCKMFLVVSFSRCLCLVGGMK